MGCYQAEDVTFRPLAHFPPDIWGEHFVTFTPEDNMKMEIYAKEIEPLKEDLRKKLFIMNDSVDLGRKLSFIDAVERLGVSYHFESEIEDMLNKIFKEFAANNFDIDYDLYNTACQFRIFRQHGHKMPCDVFNKFTNSDGKFKESLRNDIKAIVSLYEAAHLRVYGEPILDEAFAFATDVLQSSAPYSELARHALKQVLHFGIQRVESRLFISFYEEDETRHETLLKLAKIDFNRVQLLYRKELSQVLRWWHVLDFKTKLPYARQRSVECHFWSIAMYYEPQHSHARMLLVKVLLVISILDDTYDAYGTFEELELLTEAFERWDLNAMEQFPKEYMKLVFQFVYNIYNGFAKEMTELGKPYAAKFAKDREEQARGHVASGVECYMKDYNMSREEVVQIFNKMVEDAWKELNEEFLIKSRPGDDDLPKAVLKRVLNLARVVDALYKVIDGYTYSAKLIKGDIISTYTQPIPL
ncbi:(-)-germacrene D synthase-like isoform X2 [Chenopodium quinoa]|uniref:(-)-germacrene D synthase-like isoform X2 n=1 Tax=Chenopodium quinoa TaxID=63459 RepID=UPI000B784E15|nr:(-)-germacrene D synthase-like isoform X2 [Chenopodium quinoa]